MVTLHFPGIMEAGGLEGVKADGWLSHKKGKEIPGARWMGSADV